MAWVRPPKADQPGEHTQRLRRKVVLDDFNFLFNRLGAQAEELEQFRERAMPHIDVLGDRAALRREREATVFFLVQEAARGEPAHHVGHRRLAEAK